MQKRSARLVPISFLPTPNSPKPPVTLKEIIGGWQKIEFFNISSTEIPEFPGANVLGVVKENLSGNLLLVKANGEYAVYTRAECDIITRRKGLRLAGTARAPELEILGSVVFASRCLDARTCPTCQLCDSPLAS